MEFLKKNAIKIGGAIVGVIVLVFIVKRTGSKTNKKIK